MVFFNWSDNLSVGVQSLDYQHKKLIGILNELYDAMKAGVTGDDLQSILSKLSEYTQTHFSEEEKVLLSQDYPDFESHHSQHAEFINKIEDLRRQLESGRTAISLDLGTFLKNWLSLHIMGTDKRYTAFLNERGIR